MISSTSNGWMNEELARDWINMMLGTFYYQHISFAWDFYECHILLSISASLTSKKIDTASRIRFCMANGWQQPVFISNSFEKNLKPPSCQTAIRWILQCLEDLSVEQLTDMMMKKSIVFILISHVHA